MRVDFLRARKTMSSFILLVMVVSGLVVSLPAQGQGAAKLIVSETQPPKTITLSLPSAESSGGTQPSGTIDAPDETPPETEVMPNFYQEPGINPNRDYSHDQLNEYIDPFTGSLQLHFVDLMLPGNGGFDLKVQRSYNSNSIDWQRPFYRASLMGLGWTFHFGRVVKGNDTGPCANDYGASVKGNPVLELPDGSRQVFAFTFNASPMMLTASRWRADCKPPGLVVYAPDGTQYDMNHHIVELGEVSFYATKITDRNGNYATITYANDFSPEITRVTTNDGRSLTFTYADSGLFSHRVTSITTGSGQTYDYFYQAVPENLGSYQLLAVRRPNQSWGWVYLYNNLLLDANAQLLPGSYRMKTLNHGYGGIINYSYDFVNFDPIWDPGPTGRSVVISHKSVKWSNQQTASWSYTYAPGTTGQYDTTTVAGPYTTTVYRHVGADYSQVGLVWMIGLLMEKQIGAAQTETYTWDKQTISPENNVRSGLVASKVDPETYAPMMTSKVIHRDGATYQTTYSQFDDYGNPQKIEESGPNSSLRTKNLTYYLDPIKWIIHQPQDEITLIPGENTPDQLIQVNAIFRTFDANGNLTGLTQNGITTTHTYDGEGNVASTTFPRGLTHT